MRRSLLIVPHADDDVLSFGGYIISEISKGNEVIVACLTCGGPCSNVAGKIRRAEFIEAMDFLKVTDAKLYSYEDGRLDTIPNCELTTKIDGLISYYQPDNILTCYPSTHADHIALYKAFMGAIRLKEGYMPKLIAFGEYPFILPSLETPQGGKMYLPMTEEQLQRKCEAFLKYESQCKKSPSPLGVEGIKVLAQTRGLACGHKYAEMYYIHSIIKTLD